MQTTKMVDQTDNIDSITIYQINAGDDDGADFVFDFNDQRIAVSIFPCSSSQCSRYLERKQPILEIISYIFSVMV